MKTNPRIFRNEGPYTYLYELCPFKNHSRTQYTERCRGAKEGALRIMNGLLWKWFGIGARK